MTEKFQDFHAVRCTYISRKRHNIFIVWQFSSVECIVKIDELSNNVVHKIQEGSSLWDDLYYRTNLDNLGWDLIRLSQLIPIKTVLPFFIFFSSYRLFLMFLWYLYQLYNNNFIRNENKEFDLLRTEIVFLKALPKCLFMLM